MKQIECNQLLRETAPGLSLKDIMSLKQVLEEIDLSQNSEDITGSSIVKNLSLVSESIITKIYSKYGEEGLFKLQFLVTSLEHNEFTHFYNLIPSEFVFSELDEEEILVLDNPTLLQSPQINYFNYNVLQPSFSRKLYNPGNHPGYLVYGLGGPRILVSHPFQGTFKKAEVYDIYHNSIDVVTSLNIRGYFGTFLFLDNLPGLDYDINGVPAWAVWFSIIASQSDLVIYIKEYEGNFKKSQQLEIDLTPDRIQKKIVEIPHDELKWAKVNEVEFEKLLYLGEDGFMDKNDWYKLEAEHAQPFIKNYVSNSFPKDRLIKISENQEIFEFPLTFNPYLGFSPKPSISKTEAEDKLVSSNDIAIPVKQTKSLWSRFFG